MSDNNIVKKYLDDYRKYINTNDFSMALDTLSSLRELSPECPEGYSLAAFVYMRMGDFTKADEMARTGIQKTPAAINSYLVHTDSAMWQRDYRGAFERASCMCEKFPAKGIGYHRAAMSLINLGDFEQATDFAVKGMQLAGNSFEPYLAHAEIAVRQRDFQEAVKRFEVIIKNFPSQAVAYAKAAYACMDLGDFTKATDFCERGMESCKRSVEPFIARAECAMRQRQYLEAISRWKNIREQFPLSPNAFFRAASAHMEIFEFGEACALCGEGIQKFPKSFEFWNILADLELRRKNYDEAIAICEKYKEGFPHLGFPYNKMAYAFMEKGMFARAEAISLEGIANAPTSIEPYISFADAAMRQRLYVEAVNRWTGLRENFPNSPLGYVRCAQAWMEQGNFEQAQALASSAIEKLSYSIDGWNALIDINMRQKNYDDVLSICEDYQKHFPLRHFPYTKAAYAHMAKKDFEKAENICRQAMEIGPNSIEPYIAIADIAMRKKDYGTALWRWQKAREKFPYNVTPWLRAIDAYKAMGNYEMAENLNVEGVKKFSHLSEMHFKHAWLASEQKNFEEAASRWEKCVELFPYNPTPYRRLAEAQMELGKVEDAEKIVLIGMEKAPLSYDAYVMYAEIAMICHNFPEAANRWATVREKFPHIPQGYARAAKAYMDMSDVEQAKKLCDAGFKNAPLSMEPWQTAIDLNVMITDEPAAIKLCDGFIKSFPDHSQPYAKKARLLINSGKFLEAEELCLQGIKACPNLADSYIVHAEVAFRKGDYSTALKRWEIVRNAFNKHPRAYTGAIYVLLDMNEFREAEQLCEKGMETIPSCMEIYIAHAEIALRERNYSDALDRWQKIRELFPYKPVGYVRGAATHKILNEYCHAEKLCEQAKERAGHLLEPWRAWADVSMDYRDYEQALERWEIFREKFPYSSVGYTRASAASRELKNFEEAQKFARMGTDKFPFDASVCMADAECSYEQQNYEQAVQQYSHLLLKDPYNQNLYIKISRCLLNMGKIDEALQNCQKGILLLNEFDINKKLPLILFICEIFMKDPKNILQAIDILYTLYISFPKSRQLSELIEKLYQSCFLLCKIDNNIMSKEIKEEKISFGINVLLSNYIAIERGYIFLVLWQLSNIYSQEDIYNLIYTIILKYKITNSYSQLFNLKINSLKKIEILKNFIITGNKTLINLVKYDSNMRDGIDIALKDIIGNKIYLSFNNYTFYNFINLLNFYDQTESDKLIANIDNKNVLTYESIQLFKYRLNNINLNLHDYKLNYVKNKYKLKIALCISGQLRGFRACFESQKKYLLCDTHNVDYYINSWNVIGRKFPFYSHNHRLFSGKFLTTFNSVFGTGQLKNIISGNYPHFFKLLINEDTASIEDLKDFYNTDNIFLEDDRDVKFNKMLNSQKMFYKIYQCNTMTKLKSYDLIIRIRPDLKLLAPFNLSLNEIYQQSAQNCTIFIPGGFIIGPQHEYGCMVHDIFAIGVQHLMDRYANVFIDKYNIFRKQKTYGPTQNFDSHANLKYHLYANGIIIKPLDGFKSEFIDPEKLPIQKIYEAIKKDAGMRQMTNNDRLLLEACEQDMQAN